MASISFRVESPVKTNNENSPLPRTPTTQKIQELARTSSQKKARQILDSIRGLKTRGKGSSEAEGVQTGSLQRKNSSWDIFGTIRTRKSGEFKENEFERCQTASPTKGTVELVDGPQLTPRRRKSLGDILGSITNKVSPKRVAYSQNTQCKETELPEGCEEYCGEPPLGGPSNSQDSQTVCSETRISKGCFDGSEVTGAFEAHQNNLIDSYKALQLDNLLHDRDVALDTTSWTSQAQTLDDFDEGGSAPSSDGERTKTPDSYLRLMITSYDDGPSDAKGKGVAISPSPSPDKLHPTRPVDFLKDSSPEVIPALQPNTSKANAETTSSILFCADEPEASEQWSVRNKQPIITVSEVGADWDSESRYEFPVSRAQLLSEHLKYSSPPKCNSEAPHIEIPDSVSALKPTYVDSTEDHARAFRQQLDERSKRYNNPELEHLNTAELNRQRIARIIKLTVDKMTKNLHLSSNSEEVQDDWDEDHDKLTKSPYFNLILEQQEVQKIIELGNKTMRDWANLGIAARPSIRSDSSVYSQQGSSRYSTPEADKEQNGLEESAVPTNSTAVSGEDIYGDIEVGPEVAHLRHKSQDDEAIRDHISWFQSYKFANEHIHVKYPQTETRWARTELYESAELAIADVYRVSKGEYSDTITYHPRDRCIQVHSWGRPLPELKEADTSVRVMYPQTKTRWARTQEYVNKELAITDLCKQNRGEYSEITYSPSDRCIRVYANDDGPTQDEATPWIPVLTTLQEKGESDQDLPDFSDVENDFHPASTKSIKSSTSCQPEYSLDDTTANHDMSLFVEAGTPHRKRGCDLDDSDFHTAMFIGDQKSSSEPRFRGAKKILQYTDCLDDEDSASHGPYSARDLQTGQINTFDYEKAKHELLTKGNSDMFQELIGIMRKFDDEDSCSTTTDEGGTSLGIRVVEEEVSRNTLEATIVAGFKSSDYTDAFDKLAKNNEDSTQVVKELVENRPEEPKEKEKAPADFKEIIFDFELEKGALVVGDSASFKDMDDDAHSEASEGSKENLFIVPIKDVELFEENAGCGEQNEPSLIRSDRDIHIGAENCHSSPSKLKPIDNILDRHNKIIAAFRREIEETSPGREKPNPYSAENLPAIQMWERLTPFMESLPVIPDASVAGHDTEIPSYAELQDENLRPLPLSLPTSNKGKEIEARPHDTETAERIIQSQLAQMEMDEKKRVGALVDIFQARGTMAPASARSTPHRSPPRMHSGIRGSDKECTSIRMVRVGSGSEEKKVEISVRRIIDRARATSGMDSEEEYEEEEEGGEEEKEEEQNEYESGDETDVSSGFGELLEKMGGES